MQTYFTSFLDRLSLLALLALAAMLCGCASNTASQSNSDQAATLPPVMATVNGREISTKFYQMYLKNGREGLGLDPQTDAGRRQLDKLSEGIVSELIDRALITQEAERRGLAVPPEKLAETEQRAIAELGGEQQYASYLAEHRLTKEEYRDVLKTQIYGELMRNELNKGISIADEDIKSYYEAHSKDQDFQQPELVKASHILIAARPNLIAQQLQQEKKLTGAALDAAVREEKERRRQRAEELRRKAATGADFAALARQSSDDAGTRDHGGDLGTFGRASHTQAFDAAAFSLKPGDVSPVVETDFGFHVIKVWSHEPARARTLAEATPEIRNRLFAEREAKSLKDWLTETRQKAAIHLNEPFRFGALKTEFGSN